MVKERQDFVTIATNELPLVDEYIVIKSSWSVFSSGENRNNCLLSVVRGNTFYTCYQFRFLLTL